MFNKFLLAIICFTVINLSYASPASFTKTSFQSLPNWAHDDQGQAFLAFKRSCAAVLRRDPNITVGPKHSAKAWQRICHQAEKIRKPTKLTARRFFETHFQPYAVSAQGYRGGLFTGYYLPLLQCNVKRSARYHVPVYGLPSDLVKVANPQYRSQTMVRQRRGNYLYPYPDRAAINAGAIAKKAEVLVWCDNVLDVFFAQVQGSSLVKLPNKKQYIITYAGGNGRPYTSIGKVLIEQNVLTKENVSMQTIRAWLINHPKQMHAILNLNQSYIFFKTTDAPGPLGTQKIPLTAERSLAVDTRYIPLGTPVWLDTSYPSPTGDVAGLRRLVIAQDTGGAIKGIIRGDVYWGAGNKAAYIAGHMNNVGQYWVLLPRG